MVDKRPDSDIVPEVEESVQEGNRVPENASQDDVRPDGEQEEMDVAEEEDSSYLTRTT